MYFLIISIMEIKIRVNYMGDSEWGHGHINTNYL